jgi:hypothetical protein
MFEFAVEAFLSNTVHRALDTVRFPGKDLCRWFAFGKVDRNSPDRGCGFEALFNMIDDIDARCTPEKGRIRGEKADRAGAEDSHRIPCLKAGPGHSDPGSGENIGEN